MSLILCNYLFFLVVGIIPSLSKFDYNRILLIFTRLCIGSLGLIYYSLQVCTLKQCLSYPFTPIPW